MPRRRAALRGLILTPLTLSGADVAANQLAVIREGIGIVAEKPFGR